VCDRLCRCPCRRGRLCSSGVRCSKRICVLCLQLQTAPLGCRHVASAHVLSTTGQQCLFMSVGPTNSQVSPAHRRGATRLQHPAAAAAAAWGGCAAGASAVHCRLPGPLGPCPGHQVCRKPLDSNPDHLAAPWALGLPHHGYALLRLTPVSEQDTTCSCGLCVSVTALRVQMLCWQTCSDVQHLQSPGSPTVHQSHGCTGHGCHAWSWSHGQ
jgi:hypothetical protein